MMKKVFEMPEIEVTKFETEEIMDDRHPSWSAGGDDMGWEE